MCSDGKAHKCTDGLHSGYIRRKKPGMVKGFGPGNDIVSGVTEVGKIAGGRKNQELSFECVKLRCLLDIQVEM